MLSIKELRIKNIGRFVDEQIIKFDELGNLVQVDGENNNTGGSSGSGKSTIFNSIDYLLGLNDVPSTVLQSRLTKEGINVSGQFNWDGKDVELVRGKGKLSITVNGEKVEGSAKLVEEKIDEMIGMSRDLFRPILHKRQKEGGFFLSMPPSKVHEFLTNCLNLNSYKNKLDTVDLHLKETVTKKTALEFQLGSLKSALTATQDAITSLGLPPVKDVEQSTILGLNAKHLESAAKLYEIQAKQKTELDELEKKRPVAPEKPQLIEVPFDRTQWDIAQLNKEENESAINYLVQQEKDRVVKVQSGLQERKHQLSTLLTIISTATQAQVEAQQIAGEIKKIRDSICPTCEQNWVHDSAKVKEKQLLEKISALKLKIVDGAQAKDRSTTLNMEIELLTKELTPQINEDVLPAFREKINQYIETIALEKNKYENHSLEQNKRNRDLMDSWSAKYKAINDEFAQKQQSLRVQHELELTTVRGQAIIDQRTYDAAVSKLEAYSLASKRYETTLSSLKEQEQNTTASITKATEVLSQYETDLIIFEEIKRAIKSFMSHSFDEALATIGDVSTQIIRSIPNMANATIQFQGIKETQAGKVKEEVNAVISLDGEEGIDIRSLSGGERSSADLAIDLAVIDLIETRSNKGINIFILDEPFTGLDTVSVEMVLEVLKSAKINKKLIVVDHNPVIAEFISSRIIVKRDGLTSSIRN